MTVPPSCPLVTQHTLFTARYRTAKGVRLQMPPCDRHRVVLTDPARYDAAQATGIAMREAGVAAFEYESARDPGHGTNIGLFAPQALASTKPTSLENWLCETSDDHVRFLARDGNALHEFPLAMFLVDGILPAPAA